MNRSSGRGVQHGIAREYAEDGEAVYEYGILLSRSEDGQFRQVYRLADDSPNRRLLEPFRWEKGWPEIGLAVRREQSAVFGQVFGVRCLARGFA